jgi:hypothetical protein
MTGVALLLLTLGVGSAKAQNTFPSSGNVGTGTTSIVQSGSQVGRGALQPLSTMDESGGIGVLNASQLQLWDPTETYANLIYTDSAANLHITGNNGGTLNLDTVGQINFNGYSSPGVYVTRMILSSSGNVGIGTTTSPQSLLTLESAATTGTTIELNNTYYNSTDGSEHIAGEIRSTFPIRGGQYLSVPAAYMRFLSDNTVSAYPGNVRGSAISFGTVDNNLGTNFSSLPAIERMRINADGNVGIGTTTPGADLASLTNPPASGTPILEVKGDIALAQGSGGQVIYQDGTVQSTAWNGVLSGGDYAESVNVSGGRDEYEPGDVLVIDPASEGRFLKSSAPYSTAVTGIYSTRPGVVGRRQRTARAHMDEEVPMAMTGIVPTKVSAENGPIKPGDLLVTSSRPGYAMRGTDRTQMLGAVIGKAIGHLDSGVGVIEAVVTLQ